MESGNINQLDGVAPLRGVPQLQGEPLHLPSEVVAGKESSQHQDGRVDGGELARRRICVKC